MAGAKRDQLRFPSALIDTTRATSKASPGHVHREREVDERATRRVSTGQFARANPQRQLDGIVLDQTYTDRLSGKDVDRPQLSEMLRFVRAGDTVTVHSLDRLARNLDDLRRLINELTGRGVRVEFLKEQLTFTSEDNPMAQLLLSVMGAFAEFERSLIGERQREGIALAKARGAYRGRKRILGEDRIAELRQRAGSGGAQGHVGAGVRHQPGDGVPVPARTAKGGRIHGGRIRRSGGCGMRKATPSAG